MCNSGEINSLVGQTIKAMAESIAGAKVKQLTQFLSYFKLKARSNWARILT